MSAKPNPTMQACKSSQVKAHGHCATTNTLCVEYASGGKYHYEGVSAPAPATTCAGLGRSFNWGEWLAQADELAAAEADFVSKQLSLFSDAGIPEIDCGCYDG